MDNSSAKILQLTAEGAAPPWLDLHSCALASQSVGLDAVTQGIFVATHSTHIKHAMRHICCRVNFTMAGFERSIRYTHDATGVRFSVQSSLGLLTCWTLASTAPTHLPRQVNHPCLSKVIDFVCLSATGKSEVITTPLVVVAAKTTHLPLVCRRHDHLNIINCVIQDCQSKVCPDDYVATFLGDSETPIVQGERKV